MLSVETDIKVEKDVLSIAVLTLNLYVFFLPCYNIII